MDKIFIHALKTEAIIGIFDWERQVKQTVIVDIEISADIRKAALSDSIEDTLNYKRVAKRVLAVRRRVEISPGRNPRRAHRHAHAGRIRHRLGAHLLEQAGRHPQFARRRRGARARSQRLGNLALACGGRQALSWPDRAPPMPQRILLDRPLSWRQVADVAMGRRWFCPMRRAARIGAARSLVDSIVPKGLRAYGVNTGVGALCDVVVTQSKQEQLSRNILMSHAVGVGPTLGGIEVRAIMAAAVNNFALGYSGVRPAVVERLLALLAHDCVPEVPAGGSVGYLTHMAHIALVLIGQGTARLNGRCIGGAEALRSMQLAPLVLGAKEGLSLVNGTPCATGLSVLALDKTQRLLDWADIAAAMTFENLQGQVSAFDADALGLRVSAGVAQVGERLRALLSGSAILEHSAGRRTQDALSLRAVPQVHGAARDLFAHAVRVVDDELASVTDNPVVLGTADEPRALVRRERRGRGAGPDGRFARNCRRGNGGHVGAPRGSIGEPSGEPFARLSGNGRGRGLGIHDRPIHGRLAGGRQSPSRRAGELGRRSHFGAAGGSSQPCDAGRSEAAQDHRQCRDHRGG